VVRVKICGITNLDDALSSAKAGADALGFVFAKSPRRVSEAKAKQITSSLGSWVTKVGVFVNASASEVDRTMKRCGLDIAQLHGDETAATARSLRAKGHAVIKAFRVGPKLDADALRRFPADAILLDTAATGLYGGTGQRFDWKVLKGLGRQKRIIISGGLKPANVQELLKTYTPFGVDVSSGVESAPGKKDAVAVKNFIKNAKKL